MSDKFPVMEVFGPTIQGEGIMCGKQTMFVRFGGCDYRCTRCDSLHAVDPKQIKAGAKWMQAQEIVDALVALPNKAPWITISGGNPMMHDLSTFVALSKQAGFKIAVETQGSLWRSWVLDCDSITISPKGPGMGETTVWEQFDSFYKQVAFFNAAGREHCVKVVIFGDEDIEFAKEVQKRIHSPLYLSLGNDFPPNNPDADTLPAHRTLVESLLEKYYQLADKLYSTPELRDAIFLPQLHVLIYGNAQGR